MVYLDQQADCSCGHVGNVVPERKLADGARLFQDGAPQMSFVAFESNRGRFQIDKVT